MRPDVGGECNVCGMGFKHNYFAQHGFSKQLP